MKLRALIAIAGCVLLVAAASPLPAQAQAGGSADPRGASPADSSSTPPTETKAKAVESKSAEAGKPPEKKAEPKKEVSGRELNGHRFMRSELVPWPFATSFVGMSTGVGYFTTGVQDIISGGTVNPAFVVLGQRFSAGVGIFNWFAIQTEFTGYMYSPTDTAGVINQGALLRGDIRGRLVGRILNLRNVFHLGVALEGGYTTGKGINPSLLIDELRRGNLAVSLDTAIVDFRAWDIQPSILIAIAPVSVLGFQISTSFSYGQQTAEAKGQRAEAEDKELTFGAALSLDLSSVRVPIGIPLAYLLTVQDLGGSNTLQHQIEAGVMYTGVSHLDLGLVGQMLLLSEDKTYTAVIRMYYHW
jgi:hypothetical protein